MIKRVRITQKGDIKPLLEDFKKGGVTILQKLAAKEDFSLALASKMKDAIKEGKTFRSLKKSTREIRRDRREGKGLQRTVPHDVFRSKRRQKPKHLTKPLFETGQLHDSIKQIKIGVNKFRKTPEIAVSFWKYGLYQANGFIVGSDFRGIKAASRKNKLTESGREFVRELVEKKHKGVPLHESEKRLIKLATDTSMQGRVVPPRDFITIASKDMAKHIIKTFKKEFPKHIAKRLRPNIIVKQ